MLENSFRSAAEKLQSRVFRVRCFPNCLADPAPQRRAAITNTTSANVTWNAVRLASKHSKYHWRPSVKSVFPDPVCTAAKSSLLAGVNRLLDSSSVAILTKSRARRTTSKIFREILQFLSLVV